MESVEQYLIFWTEFLRNKDILARVVWGVLVSLVGWFVFVLFLFCFYGFFFHFSKLKFVFLIFF